MTTTKIKARAKAGKSGKSKCRNGHRMTGKNLIIHKQGWRVCRKCHNASNRAWKQRNQQIVRKFKCASCRGLVKVKGGKGRTCGKAACRAALMARTRKRNAQG